MSDTTRDFPELAQAYTEHDRQTILQNVKIGCYLGFFLMPAGVLLDYFYFQDEALVYHFLRLRLLCSLLIAVFWGLVISPFGRAHPRKLGVVLAMFPAFFISWMIYEKEGVESPYYAGLNLVLLVIGYVVQWSFAQSIVAVLSVMMMYIGACALNGNLSDFRNLANNLYFLVLTGIIVATGSYFQNRAKFREFVLRFELDKSKDALVASNEKLVSQNHVLEDTNQKLNSTITELNQTRDQLVQSEKMASLGRMSAGIIHEINNPLNYATSGLFALRKNSKFIPEERRTDYEETVGDVQDGINRVNNIVSNLRIFTHPMFMRPDSAALAEVPVKEIVEEALRGVSHLVRDPFKIVNEVQPGHQVRADRQKLVQVLENLVRNALDALGSKSYAGETPTIWVETRVLTTGPALVVRDNGPGIKAEDLARVFDPFFTTKDVGKGMGLGLTVCQGIMQAIGGKISVRSELGKFCEFLLEFPDKA